jgi:MFS family permease
VVVDLVGFGIVVPVLPFFAREFGASGTLLGLILASFAAAQFACARLWGRLSDRVGRRPVLLATIAGTAGSLLLLGLAPSLAWIAAARILAGACAANVSVAAAYIADETSPEERTRWMGLLGAAFGVGFVLGPAIGGALAPFGHRLPFFAAAALAAGNGLHAWRSLREPAGRAAGDTAVGRGDVLRDPRVLRVCLANFVFAFAVTQLETVFAFFMQDRFGWGAARVALILVFMAVLMGAVQGGGMRALAARLDERALAVAGCALLAAGFGAAPLAPGVGILLVPLALAALGRAVVQPSLMSLASLAAAPEARGAVLGSFQAAASLARVGGPLVAGWLYDRAQPGPFWLAAGLLAALALAGRALPSRAAAAGYSA